MTDGRAQVMANIRRALGVTGAEATRRAEVDERLAGAPAGLIPARGQLPPAARVALFRDMALMAQASLAEVPDAAAVPAAVADYLRSQNLPQRIRRGADPRLTALSWEAGAVEVTEGPSDGSDEVGLSHAEAGVAETGTLLMFSGAHNPSTLNFLPDTHIVVLEARDVVGSYEDGWRLARQRFGKGVMPRTVNWITGPSRSADIEQTLLLGAHGPRRLHVVLVGTAPEPQALLREETTEFTIMSSPNAPAGARKEEERMRREEDLQGKSTSSPGHEEKKLDKEVKDSFPASDTPSAIQPGGGITGPEVARKP